MLVKVHKTQTDLVKSGYKVLEDLKYGEEERSIKYDRCCYWKFTFIFIGNQM